MRVAVVVIAGADEYTYGSNVTFLCAGVFGEEPYACSWEVPPGSSSLTNGNVSTTDEGTLLTFTAFESDSGEYTCTCVDNENEVKSASESIEVGKSFTRYS